MEGSLIEMEENDNNNNNVENIITKSKESNNMEFPDGMRVLAVDDNVVCLTFLTALLSKCRYQVTSLRSKTDALAILKQNVDNFDIVLTDVSIDEIDGFTLLEAGLELDIPVIMISSSESKSIIMKGVRHGAVDYLIKPIRLEAVQNIWQHVYRKKLDFKEDETRGDLTIRPSENSTGNDDMKLIYIEEIQGDLETINTGSKRVGKRKSSFGDGDDGSNDEDPSNPSTKRERIKWTKPLHEKFMEVVEALGGIDHAVPKKILELMNESGLTREKVASHLQKFRKTIKKKLKYDDCDGHNNSHNIYPHLTHPSIGSSMATPLSHQPIPGNNMPQGLVLSSNYSNQPSNSNWWGPQSVGYMSTLLQDGHQLVTPQTNMMAINGSFMGPDSSLWVGQPSLQTSLRDVFVSGMQAPEEMLDPCPSHSTYETPPSAIPDVPLDYSFLYNA